VVLGRAYTGRGEESVAPAAAAIPTFPGITHGVLAVSVAQWHLNSGNLATVALSAGRLYLSPGSVAATFTPAAIGVSITTGGAASSVLRIAIYSDDGGKPGNLFWLSEQLPADAIVNRRDAVADLPELEGGAVYWWGVVSNGAPTVRCVAVGAVYPLGLAPAMNGGTVFTVLSATSVTPATPPNPWTSTTLASAPVPAIYLVYS
jgi:hypothetical protein